MAMTAIRNDFPSGNAFLPIWERFEVTATAPGFVRDVVIMPYGEFRDRVCSNDPETAEALVRSIYGGDAYILKGAFDRDYLQTVLERAHAWGLENPSTFHKMLEGCPDFQRCVDAEASKKYSMLHVKQSYYTFPWNEDPLGVVDPVNERWRVFKYLGGYEAIAYEHNTPEDGVVDRIQVVKYPAGGGVLESHTDPRQNQRVIIGAMMSERGVHYERGGFYFVREDGSVLDCEPDLEIGDMVVGYPSIVHGVAPVDPDQPLDWTSKKGRWFLGLYSNDSDHMPRRTSASSLGDVYPSPNLPLSA